MKKLFLTVCFLLITVNGYAACDCDSTTLQAAIDAASDGDTITCNAGAFTWTASPTITGKGLTIVGAGTDAATGTRITHANKPLTINLADANSTVDVSGLRITMTAAGSIL